MPTEPMIELDVIAEELGVHPETLRRAIRDGKLSAYRIGKKLKVKPVDYEKYLESLKVKPQEVDETTEEQN